MTDIAKTVIRDYVNEWNNHLYEWSKKRNALYRSMKNIQDFEMIKLMWSNRAEIEKEMDAILPEELHSSTKPTYEDFYKIILSKEVN